MEVLIINSIQLITALTKQHKHVEDVPSILAKPSPDPMMEYVKDMMAATTESHFVFLKSGTCDTKIWTSPNRSIKLLILYSQGASCPW